MIDTLQLYLALIIFVLTVIFSVIGVQVYFILKELRSTVQKVNKVLDDTGAITESVSRPMNMFSTLVMGLRGGSKIAKFLTKTEGDD